MGETAAIQLCRGRKWFYRSHFPATPFASPVPSTFDSSAGASLLPLHLHNFTHAKHINCRANILITEIFIKLSEPDSENQTKKLMVQVYVVSLEKMKIKEPRIYLIEK
jgi:hypothetical protein